MFCMLCLQLLLPVIMQTKPLSWPIKTWDVSSLHRAAVLERMPVIEKNSPGHTNGESAGEPMKEIQPPKVKQGEPLLPQQPANQVHHDK